MKSNELFFCLLPFVTVAVLSYEEEIDIPPEAAFKLVFSFDMKNISTETNNREETEGRKIIEGDIMGPIFEDDTVTQAKTPKKLNHWPNATIPFYIEEKYFSKEDMEVIRGGIKYINENTCVTIRPYNKTTDKDFVRITGKTDGGCLSELGRQSGGQEVNLEPPKCIFQHWVIHELMHSVGFYHQHSAYNRDDYIKILFENIEPEEKHNFQKYTKDMSTDFDIGYDYFSIMHYRADVFSKNGEPTIKPLNESIVLKQSDNMTMKDLQKIQKMYSCKSITSVMNEG